MLLNPCWIYLEMNQQSVVHEQKLRHDTNELALLLSLKKKREGLIEICDLIILPVTFCFHK